MIPAGGPLTVVVLGASGAVGRLLVAQALERGHHVRAIVRATSTFTPEAHPRLTVHHADVHDAKSIEKVVTPNSVIVSGLGVRSKAEVGTLTAGARSAVAASPAFIVWLGAVGTGRSAHTTSGFTRWLLKRGFGEEYGDKVAADGLVLDARGTVVHAGPMNDRIPPRYEGATLTSVSRRFFPAFAARSGVAQVMLDEAEARGHAGEVIVPRPA